MRNPWEVFMLTLCVTSGISNLIAPPPLPDHVPLLVAQSWYWLLIFGGLTSLTGLAWRDILTGTLISRAGHIPIGFGAYAYAFVVGYAHNGRSLLAAAILLGFGTAAHCRAYQIKRLMRLPPTNGGTS